MSKTISTQKIIRVGNSLAITLDSTFAKSANLKHGSKLQIEYDHDSGALTAKTVEPYRQGKDQQAPVLSDKQQEEYVSSKITPEFRAWVKKSLEHDAEAMKELANL